MNKLKLSIDQIKRTRNLLGRKNVCDAIDESVIATVTIMHTYFIDCTCEICGMKAVCKNILTKDCKYIQYLQEEINKMEIKL